MYRYLTAWSPSRVRVLEWRNGLYCRRCYTVACYTVTLAQGTRLEETDLELEVKKQNSLNLPVPDYWDTTPNTTEL